MIEERLPIGLAEVEEMEKRYLWMRHVERYALVRQYCAGRVLDVACGTGYGSHLIAKNPDVVEVLGIDRDGATVDFARSQFGGLRVQFECVKLEEFGRAGLDVFQTVVALEIIEHLGEPEELVKLSERVEAAQVILTFPTKKTTHYNPFHVHDFTGGEVIKLFPQMVVVGEANLWNDAKMMRLMRRPVCFS